MYKYFLKRLFDIVLSLFGIILLSPVMLILAIAIKCDSKGPVFFKQKRIGNHKKTFMILKFRTMRSDTPPNIPTHELSDPHKWITKVGRFIRKTSLDELPQVFNIFVGHMSIIGPRPALWNQDDLVAERDKYGANDVRPGLTGLAQISGRDELEIPEKAKFDGEYVAKLNAGWFRGFAMDWKCFWGTIACVFKQGDNGVVEGGTGEINRAKAQMNAEAHEKQPENEQDAATGITE